MDCFVAFAPLRKRFGLVAGNDGSPRHTPIFPRHRSARVFVEAGPSRTEGAGNAGRDSHPRPRVRNEVAHEQSHHRYIAVSRHSLRDGFSGFLRALPGDRALLPPSSPRSLLLKNLTSASGCQDHTASPSAPAPLVSRAPPRPPHPAPNVRDDAYAPLIEAGCANR
jgi:hypothetical protein